MKRSLLDRLCCPFDKNDLKIQVFNETEEQVIIEGVLTCSCCERYFPIIYGIPIMTPDQYREKSLEISSMKRWGLELDTKDGVFRLDSSTAPKGIE